MAAASIWELAARKLEESGEAATTQLPTEAAPRDNSVLVVAGCPDCGKTSLVLRFLDRDETPKPTIALEYTYGRRTKGQTKEVGHIWELGGGSFLTNLLDVPITAQYFADTSVVLLLDLSSPDTLWSTALRLLAAARAVAERTARELPNATRRVTDHADSELLEPFPLPLALVGAKYDVFQDFDSEKKKMVCKSLRFLAHTNAASLVFFSTKIESLVTRGRALLSHLLFASPAGKGQCIDHNKPLYVPAGTDSLQDIGAPPLNNDVIVSATTPTELWTAAFTALFPQREERLFENKEDPSVDPQYGEEAIDRLRAAKDKELERLIRQQSRRAPPSLAEEQARTPRSPRAAETFSPPPDN